MPMTDTPQQFKLYVDGYPMQAPGESWSLVSLACELDDRGVERPLKAVQGLRRNHMRRLDESITIQRTA